MPLGIKPLIESFEERSSRRADASFWTLSLDGKGVRQVPGGRAEIGAPERHRRLPIFHVETGPENRRLSAVETKGIFAVSQTVFSKPLYIVKSLEKSDIK